MKTIDEQLDELVFEARRTQQMVEHNAILRFVGDNVAFADKEAVLLLEFLTARQRLFERSKEGN